MLPYVIFLSLFFVPWPSGWFLASLKIICVFSRFFLYFFVSSVFSVRPLCVLMWSWNTSLLGGTSAAEISSPSSCLFSLCLGLISQLLFESVPLFSFSETLCFIISPFHFSVFVSLSLSLCLTHTSLYLCLFPSRVVI